MAQERLRLGMLGCANVSAYAMLQPVREGADIVVTAVAARDPARAPSYEALIRDADIDAVYVALPNGLHGRWSIAALEAGRPVLCEKPLAANAFEAETMARAAETAGLPLVEALHWRDHPVADRLRTLLSSMGPLRGMDLRYSLPGGMLSQGNIRFDPAMAGGWLMDQGCYCVSVARYFAGEPEEIIAASAVEERPGIDGGAEARLRFPGEVSCRIVGSMIDPSVRELELNARFECEGGEVTVENLCLPGANPFTREQGAQLVVRRSDGSGFEERADLVSSWFCQANAFAATVRGWRSGANPAWDAVGTMRVVDAIYEAAGMQPRQPSL
jgi:predicted dehydrogenase